MGFIGYLCAYIHTGKGKKGTQTAGEEHQQKGNRRKEHKINSA